MWTVVGTLLFISVFMVPSILAHSATLHPEDKILRKVLYTIYVIYGAFLAGTGFVVGLRNPDAEWFASISVGLSLLALLFLFRPFRAVLPKILTPLNKLAAFDFFKRKGAPSVPGDPRTEQNDAPIEQKDAPIEPKDVPTEPKDTPIEPKDVPTEPKDTPIDPGDVSPEDAPPDVGAHCMRPSQNPSERSGRMQSAPTEQFFRQAPPSPGDAPPSPGDAPPSPGDAPPEPAFRDACMLKQVFLPDSLPHLNGLVLYLLALAVSLQRLKLGGFTAPALASAPEARHMDFAIGVDFFSTLLVVAVGVGLIIRRNPREILYRLSLVKPGSKEIILGVLLCAFTFLYDFIWSTFTHIPNSALPSIMRDFNIGSYSANGELGNVLVLSLGIALVAGLEEEITNRGALQPVLGIVPAAFLHAALHTQFNAAPLFMVQIFGWSILMGTAKYYTNTTTTIIAHGLFNLISCFLIGFNP